MQVLIYRHGMSIGNIDFIFQEIENGNPILTGRFHADIKTGILKKPLFEVSDITVKCRKPFLWVRRLDTFGGFNDCGNEKSLSEILRGFLLPLVIKCDIIFASGRRKEQTYEKCTPYYIGYYFRT